MNIGHFITLNKGIVPKIFQIYVFQIAFQMKLVSIAIYKNQINLFDLNSIFPIYPCIF